MNTYVTFKSCLDLLTFCYVRIYACFHLMYKNERFFMSNLEATIKICQNDVYNMYCDQTYRFMVNNFLTFKSL